MMDIGVIGALLVVCFAFTSAGVISNSIEVPKENLHKLATANNEVAWNLYRNFAANSSGNIFFSPLSISTAFGMLFYGARGDTAEELRKALGYEKADLSSDRIQETFKHFLNEVLNTKNSSTENDLKVANALYADAGFEVLETYKSAVSESFKAAVQNVNFSRNTSEIVEEINSWISEKTNGKIERLFHKLSPSTLMVLLNAVYFKGTWQTQFNPEETRDEIFYNKGLESEGKNVSMMHITSEFLSSSNEEFQTLEMPYKGGNISMLILLPNKMDGLQALEENLTSEKLANIQEQMSESKLNIYLPKFKLEFEEELSEKMQALGAKQIFSSAADFSGMFANSSVPVSQVLHKAVIEVNEVGSEAAAATGVIIDRKKRSQFRADHPFLFTIFRRGGNRNMILFMGRVNEL